MEEPRFVMLLLLLVKELDTLIILLTALTILLGKYMEQITGTLLALVMVVRLMKRDGKFLQIKVLGQKFITLKQVGLV